MENNYGALLKDAQKKCYDCRKAYESLATKKSSLGSNNLSVTKMIEMVERIESAFADIKKSLDWAISQAKQSTQAEDYYREPFIAVLEALSKQFLLPTTCHKALAEDFAEIIQIELEKNKNASSESEEHQCKPLAVADLKITKTSELLTVIEAKVDRLILIIEALMSTENCWRNLSEEIQYSYESIGEIEAIRKSLADIIIPSWTYRKRIKNERARPNAILAAESQFLGKLYLANSEVLSWLEECDDRNWNSEIAFITKTEIKSIASNIDKVFKLISCAVYANDGQGNDRIHDNLVKLENALNWHGNLLVAIMKAATVEQV